jgi:hypothetical protein
LGGGGSVPREEAKRGTSALGGGAQGRAPIRMRLGQWPRPKEGHRRFGCRGNGGGVEAKRGVHGLRGEGAREGGAHRRRVVMLEGGRLLGLELPSVDHRGEVGAVLRWRHRPWRRRRAARRWPRGGDGGEQRVQGGEGDGDGERLEPSVEAEGDGVGASGGGGNEDEVGSTASGQRARCRARGGDEPVVREEDKATRRMGRWRGSTAACGRIQGAWSFAAGGGEGVRNSGGLQSRKTEQRQRRKRKGVSQGLVCNFRKLQGPLGKEEFNHCSRAQTKM